MLHRADTYYAPYTPRFQPPYRYPIALPRPPKAGDAYWPGQLPPTVNTVRAKPAGAKEVRFDLPVAPPPLKRSKTMPASSSSSSYKHAPTSAPVHLSPSRAANMAQPPQHRAAGIVSLVPLLAHTPTSSSPPIIYDLQYGSAYARLPAASAPLSQTHRQILATSQPIAHMRIRCDAFPWIIDVRESAPGVGIRVGDVLDALSTGLWRRLRSAEYANLDARNKQKIENAFRARVARNPAVQSEGILRLDWLQGRSVFKGLVTTSEPNTWALVLGST
ncbi:hypothetical protein EXIGLDRAFT_697509 [Exidia glandulosa HHB12029]|uniref:DUF6699 domain-containing protein n=1 Tax=Exidia glandulosa HHB12029 TaxID=1314781 RepID=A0A165EQ27_EXIGL|nr:hypothetical protein EXIGLDRAFT_697509 [Exidia glandulosa HHB12029]